MFDPVPKPNLILILSSLFSLQSVSDSRSAWEALSPYDIIMPRKVLATILANKQSEIEAYAWRPSPKSPVFIDRKSSYSTNPGAIGMQFEARSVEHRSDHYRFYGVFDVVLDGRLKILVSGEVDAADQTSGLPIEFKTKPSWSHTTSERAFYTWLQAKLACVKTIVTAGFTARRGVRNGPVTFTSSNVAKIRPDAYFHIGLSEQNNLDAGVAFLDALLKGCTSVDKVYNVSSGRDSLPVMALEEDLSHCTVTKQLIEHVASMSWQ